MLFDINGVSVEIEDEDKARALIAERDKVKTGLSSMQKQLDELRASTLAEQQKVAEATNAARLAEAKAAELELAKKGEHDAAIRAAEERVASEHQAKLEAMQLSLQSHANGHKVSQLQALIASDNRVIDTARDDIVAAITPNLGFIDGKLAPVDANGNALTGQDGSAVAVDQYVANYLEARPHLVRDSSPSRSGGNTAPGASSQQTIRRSELDATNAAQMKGIADGSICLVDD